jgi:hypothetical protein
MTRRYRYWIITVNALIPVKARTCLWSYANPIQTLLTKTKLAEKTLPTRFTLADVWEDAGTMLAIREADSLITVDTSPAFFALAALSVVHVITNESLVEVRETRRCYILLNTKPDVKRFKSL